MAQQSPTYTTIVMHSILAAPGWQAVHVDADGHHFLIPVHALALITRRERDLHTTRLLPPPSAEETEEEGREIVSLDYNPSDGWDIQERAGNFCGLLPPDWTLADFEAADCCKSQHPHAP